jgi:hypothetical protein
MGHNLDCRDSIGGIKSVYLIALDDITSVTASAGTVSAITKAVGKRFWKYNLTKATSSAASDIQASRENGTVFYAETIEMILNKQQSAVRNEVLLLAQGRLGAIVEDRNGMFHLYGKDNGLMISGGGAATGTALADRNGYTLTFTGEERELPFAVASGVITTLETPGA